MEMHSCPRFILVLIALLTITMIVLLYFYQNLLAWDYNHDPAKTNLRYSQKINHSSGKYHRNATKLSFPSFILSSNNSLSSSKSSFQLRSAVKFLMFSAMNDHYVDLYKEYRQRNQLYAQYHNYSFQLVRADDSYNHHVTGMKIFATMSFLQNYVTRGLFDSSTRHHLEPTIADWLVFLDADAFVAEWDIPLSKLVQVAESYVDSMTGSSGPCHFIAQDQNTIVNSGFYLIRNSDWSREFVSNWIKQFDKAENQWGVDLWTYDQGALMNNILQYAADLKEELYEDYCVGSAAHANKCYQTTMEKFGLPFKNRKFGNICLLPPIGIPYSFHMHNNYFRGELIRHQKGLRISSNRIPFLSTSEIWKPNSISLNANGSIILSNGSFVSYFFSRSQTPFQQVLYIILDDYKKHLIPDWETYLSLGGGSIENAIPLSEELFNEIKVGNDLVSVVK